ncbi:hypothetical protein FNH07_02775 [Amycolatopsis bartoniae]|nr:hypothetical protein FNH07_02775 [Amycolatopsis bartoniae]
MVVIFAADVAETLVLEQGLLPAAIAAGGLATVAGTYCWQGRLRGIRRHQRGAAPTRRMNVVDASLTLTEPGTALDQLAEPAA